MDAGIEETIARGVKEKPGFSVGEECCHGSIVEEDYVVDHWKHPSQSLICPPRVLEIFSANS